jgi:hypothetical protein
LGGILNPIIGIANLLFLVVVAREISAVEQQNRQHEIKLQRNYAMYALKQDGLREMVSILNKVQVCVTPITDQSLHQLELAESEIRLFMTSQDHIFRGLDRYNTQSLTHQFSKLEQLVDEHHVTWINPGKTEEDFLDLSHRMLLLLQDFNYERVKLIKFLQGSFEEETNS